MDGQRRIRRRDLEPRLRAYQRDHSSDGSPCRLHEHGHVERERRARLRLPHDAVDDVPSGALRDALDGQFQHRRAGARDPVVEEPPQVAAPDPLRGRPDVVERGAPPAEVAVEAREELPERVVAQRPAEGVEPHERAAVAHRFGGRAVTAAELGEREVLRGRDVVAVLLQRRAAVDRGLAALLLQQVVGQVGREPLGPVAARLVHEHRVAPPVVQDLVRVRRGEDEREADDLRAEQRERRHAVSGLPEILDEREFPVRIRPDELAVHLEVLRRRGEVLRAQRRIGLVQVDLRLDGAGRLGRQVQGPADDVDLVDRVARRPARPAVVAARRAAAFTDDAPGARLCDREVEGDELASDQGVPGAGAGEVHAFGRDHAGGRSEAAGVLLAPVREAEVERAGVLEMNRRAGLWQRYLVPLDLGALVALAALDLAQPGDVAGRDLARRGRRAGQREAGVEEELDRGGRSVRPDVRRDRDGPGGRVERQRQHVVYRGWRLGRRGRLRRGRRGARAG